MALTITLNETQIYKCGLVNATRRDGAITCDVFEVDRLKNAWGSERRRKTNGHLGSRTSNSEGTCAENAENAETMQKSIRDDSSNEFLHKPASAHFLFVESMRDA